MRALLATVLVVATSASAQTTAQCERIVNVGSWNIQWLGNAKAGKRQPQDPGDIAAYVAAGKVDVLGLAEISATSNAGNGPARNQTLDDAFQVLNASGAKWRYVLFEKRPGARAPEDQWTGLAWNEAVVTLTGGPWRLDVTVDAKKEDDIRARFDSLEKETIVLSRWPYAVKFSADAGKSDFVAVPVHLKSNIGGKATEDARAYEVELIQEGLEKLKAQHNDDDLIVMGDTNMLASDEPAGASFSAMGLKDCNARDLRTHLPGRRGEKAAPFDRVLVMAQQPETAPSCPAKGNGKGPLDFKIVRPAELQQGMTTSEFRKRLSDHLMVRTGFCVMNDDD